MRIPSLGRDAKLLATSLLARLKNESGKTLNVHFFASDVTVLPEAPDGAVLATSNAKWSAV